MPSIPDKFDIRTKAIVLWSPTLLISGNDEFHLEAKCEKGITLMSFRDGADEVMRIDRVAPMKEPRFKLAGIGVAFERSTYLVITNGTAVPIATVIHGGAVKRSNWTIHLPSGRNVFIQHTGKWLARWLQLRWPQRYRFVSDDLELGSIRERIFPFGEKLSVDLTNDPGEMMDRRVAVAVAALMALSLDNSLSSPAV